MSNYAIDFRPKTIDEMFGVDFGFKNYIKAQAKNNFVDMKAVLLQGKYGSGKTTAASILGKMVTCQHRKPNGDPCNECPECKAVDEGLFNKSVVLLGAESLNKGALREQMENLNTRPLGGKSKVIIIDEFQELSPEAKNLFLHVLEDKNKNYIHWIFTSMEAIPPSGMTSRMKKFIFKEPTQDQIAQFLLEFVTKTCDENGLILEQLAKFIPQDEIQNVLLDIAYRGEGSYRAALQKLEEVVVGKDKNIASVTSGTLAPIQFIDLLLNIKKDGVNRDKLYQVSRQFQGWGDEEGGIGILGLVKYTYAMYIGWLTGNMEIDSSISKSYLEAGIKAVTSSPDKTKAFKELASIVLSPEFQNLTYNFNITPKVKSQRTFLLLLQDYFNMK